MTRMRTLLFSALALLGCIGATTDDFAVINNSGSTNANGYIIQIWADGDASIMPQSHGGQIAGAPKAFNVPPTIAQKLFSDLAAARQANAATVPCMKPVSFGSTLRVSWQGWDSPDLTCPPKDSLGDALLSDAEAIAKAGGVANTP
ncbi:MAG TPA: hypothetical protein VEW74_05810 [Candidatus Nitrosotalea sp.]|nr:hypothetical protein [Candidatus Nitrosotalea sp.]